MAIYRVSDKESGDECEESGGLGVCRGSGRVDVLCDGYLGCSQHCKTARASCLASDGGRGVGAGG